MAGLLAVRAGLPWPRLGLITLAVGTGQLSIGWLNDWWDAERDARAGRDDKPVPAGAIGRAAVGGAAAAAATACVIVSSLLGAAGAVNLVTVASAWVYDLWAKATRWSAVPYVVSFGLLPAVVTLAAEPPRWPPAWMTVAAALLGAGGHFANALPDLEADGRTGVRGLPQRLGPRRTRWAGAGALGAGVAVASTAMPGAVAGVVVTVALGLLAAAVGFGRRGRPRTAFRLTMVLAVLAVAALLVPPG